MVKKYFKFKHNNGFHIYMNFSSLMLQFVCLIYLAVCLSVSLYVCMSFCVCWFATNIPINLKLTLRQLNKTLHWISRPSNTEKNGKRFCY